jgi:hypothetical protein
MVIELHLEDQWHNRMIGAWARCPHFFFYNKFWNSLYCTRIFVNVANFSEVGVA